MTRHRWPAVPVPDDLGVIVHGPVLLARAPGIAVGLRCVFAHPDGLHLPLVLHATGVHAEAAARQSFRRNSDPPADSRGAEGAWSGMVVTAEVDGTSGVADPAGEGATGGGDAFRLRASYWVGALPVDHRLRLTVAWPQAGLPATSSELRLEPLENLAERVVRLT